MSSADRQAFIERSASTIVRQRVGEFSVSGHAGDHSGRSISRYECGWARDRGPTVCASTLRVRRVELEDRVLGAIGEQVLDIDLVAFVVQRTIEEVASLVAQSDPAADRKRLSQLDAKRERIVRMAAEGEGIDDVVRKLLAEVRRERDEILGRLEVAPVAFNPAEWRPLIERRVMELRGLFSGPQGRDALRELPGGRTAPREPEPQARLLD